MQKSSDFLDLTHYFFGESLELAHNNVDIWVERAVRMLEVEKRQGAKLYIEALLQSDATDEDLLTIWNKSRAGYYVVHAHQMRGFLTLLCEKLG